MSTNHNENQGPINNNGHRSATGLVVAGLVTVAGSWIGMAAYLDYRLQSVERITKQTKQEVVSVIDTSQSKFNQELGAISNALSDKINTTSSTLDKKIGSINDNLSLKISDTSSVLAKGILDLTKKSDERYSQTIETVIETKNSIAQIPESLKTLQNQSVSEIASLIQQSGSKLEANQTTILKSNVTLYEAINAVDQKTQKTGDAVLTAVLDLDNDLADTKSGLIARIDEKTKALEDLVVLAGENQNGQLSQLVTTMSDVSGTLKIDSKKLSDELTALADNLGVIKQEIASSQVELEKINTNVPGWQSASVEKITALNDSTLALNQKIQEQMDTVQTKLANLTQTFDNTTASLMKALYVTSEGLEGTRLELKSDLETSKNEMSAEIKGLVQSVEQISNTLKGLELKTTQNASSNQSSMAPLTESQEFQNLSAVLKSISDQTFDLRSHLCSQAAEADAHVKEILEDSSEPEVLKDVLVRFAKITEGTSSELDTLIKNLESLDGIMKTINIPVAQSPELEQATADVTPTPAGMNPEERTKEVKEVSLH